jgi:hypothetical protein
MASSAAEFAEGLPQVQAHKLEEVMNGRAWFYGPSGFGSTRGDLFSANQVAKCEKCGKETERSSAGCTHASCGGVFILRNREAQ